jgi:hypothetical protein
LDSDNPDVGAVEAGQNSPEALDAEIEQAFMVKELSVHLQRVLVLHGELILNR